MGLWGSPHVGFRGTTLPKEIWGHFSQSHHVTAVACLRRKKLHRSKLFRVERVDLSLQLGDVQRVSGRRGARTLGLKPLDVAAVAEQVSLQWVTTMALLVVQSQTTVLTVVALHMIVSVHRDNSNSLL